MRNFLLAAIVLALPSFAFAQCANGVCRSPQRGFTFQQQTQSFSGGCANGQCAANGQCSAGGCANGQCSAGNQCSQRTTVMATHTPIRNAVRNVRFMPFRRLFR